MKKLLFMMWATLAFSCNNGGTSVAAGDQLLEGTEDFNWLVGNWRRINEQEDRKTFETWTMKNNSEYVGFGFTLQNKDTIWQENVRLAKSAGGWNFEVTGKGETKPTIFKLITIEMESFACENQENEFPKAISYSKAGNQIKAVISGGGMEIPFEFERVAQK